MATEAPRKVDNEGVTQSDRPVVVSDPALGPETYGQESPGGRANALDRWLIRRALSVVGDPAVTVALWDGTRFGAAAENAAGRITIGDRATLWKLAWRPAFHFPEGYAEGRIRIEGNLLDVLLELHRGQKRAGGPRRHRSRRWWPTRGHNTPAGSRENIHHHYDLGNEFYQLWLDPEMAYTCAYFPRPGVTLDEAQVAKFDHVCRKLRLAPGEEVVEAGCGWGGLALHMAREYGVSVRAYNISREQVAYARQRVKDEGLEGRVEFVHDDWRTITGRYDAFVSVGMLEHVGIENYRQLGEVVRDSLKPDGRGLIHTIGMNWPRKIDRWTQRRIFPGAQPPTLRQMMDIFEGRDFSVHDVENLRLHYALTCKYWLDRFEKSVDRVREMFDERFVRMWRFYLACSASAFETGWLQLFQVVFAPGQSNVVPCSRGFLYSNADPEFLPPCSTVGDQD